jgi:Zn-dependent peptidase ImmA (M78 family)/DNA-binding XRE family transcriptional regulator
MREIGKRIKQLRLGKGYSLEELSEAIGRIVTKQALSKYELGKDNPSPKVIQKLSTIFNVRPSYLLSKPDILVEFKGFRKRAGMGKRYQEQIKSQVEQELETRVNLQSLAGEVKPIHVTSWKVTSLKEAEDAANKMRKEWQLGLDPIDNLTALLENQRIHVIEMKDGPKEFDGISAVAKNNEGSLLAIGVVSWFEKSGDRQRFTLSHELGHIVLDYDNPDQEKIMNRFAGAFLAPADTVYKVVGKKRHQLSLEEMLIYKAYFKMSIQALLFRFRDLDVITQGLYENWLKTLDRMGMRKIEPGMIEVEKPQWKEKMVLRAYNEGLIDSEKAMSILGNDKGIIIPEKLKNIREITRLPLSERHKILEKEALSAKDYYENDSDWREFSEGDVIDG